MKKNGVRLNCLTCGADFYVPKHRAQSAMYCSSTCRPFGGAQPYKASVAKCAQCGRPFKKVKDRNDKFCGRECYKQHCYDQKPCKQCGKERCAEHSKQKQAKWRKNATKRELKARSLQNAYRKASKQTLSLAEARTLMSNPPDCPYCGEPIPWQRLSIDHTIPISRGGASEPSNLRWVDWSCNLMKGNLLPEEFMLVMNFMKANPEIGKYLETRLKAGAGFLYKKYVNS